MRGLKVQNKTDGPFICPHCGEEVPAKAKCCPHCGSDDETGWAENAGVGDLSETLDDEDYKDLQREEFGGKQSRKPFEIIIAIVAAIILLLWIISLWR